MLGGAHACSLPPSSCSGRTCCSSPKLARVSPQCFSRETSPCRPTSDVRGQHEINTQPKSWYGLLATHLLHLTKCISMDAMCGENFTSSPCWIASSFAASSVTCRSSAAEISGCPIATIAAAWGAARGAAGKWSLPAWRRSICTHDVFIPGSERGHLGSVVADRMILGVALYSLKKCGGWGGRSPPFANGLPA